MNPPLLQSQRGVCKTCRASIIWASEKGRLMPIDRAPGVDGNIELTERDFGGRDGVKLIARVVGRRADGVNRYVAHFLTCPDASKHRRAR